MSEKPIQPEKVIHFADETTSGERCASLRGLRRITIAAKCSADDSFEWLRRFNHDHLGDVGEVKSDLVLAVMEQSRAARDKVLAEIAGATIAIIDLAENTRWLFRQLAGATGVSSDGIRSGTAFLKSGVLPQDLAQEILRFGRRDALSQTAVGRVEFLLSFAAEKCNVPLGAHVDLFDPTAFDDLSEREFSEFAGRFALALGDALHPDTQADVITNKLADLRFCHAGHVALAFLEAAVEPDAVFDQGSSNAFALLDHAHQKVVDAISAMRIDAGQFLPGSVSQEDSAKLLGLQAADIAASIARRTLEQEFRSTLEAARALRSVFARIILNDRWIEEYA